MSFVRMFTADGGHRLRFEMTGDLNSVVYAWEALVFEGHTRLGKLVGDIRKNEVPPEHWNEAFLQSLAVQRVEQGVKEKGRSGW